MLITRRIALIDHILVGLAAVVFAFCVSRTSLITTGVQFVGPAAVIFAGHLLFLAQRGQLTRGFSGDLVSRAFVTAAALLAVVLGIEALAPMPAHAQAGEILGGIGVIIFCLAIIAIVGFVIWAVFAALFKVGEAVYRAVRPDQDDDPDSRRFDFGTMIGIASVLGVLSLEGLPQTYAFRKAIQVSSEVVVDAAPEVVWETMQTATSPDFPLPAWLMNLPRPVAVEMDEGTGFGAKRVVRIEGREGIGHLRLQVVEATPLKAVFEVVSDTAPTADWATMQTLTYEITPEAEGARLTVSMAFERELAPAVVFNPMMTMAGNMAMDVLARDVKARAEGG